MKRAVRLLLLICIGIGILLRLLSVGWNDVVHGDIELSIKGANALMTNGTFQFSTDTTLSLAEQYLIQHPPIWSILGALTMKATGVDAFTALKLMSLLCGILIVFLMYYVSKEFVTKNQALFLTGLVSISWLMIDFSGNGALYSLHTLLFLAWIYVAKKQTKHTALLLAAISAAAYLTNYQTIILIPATLLLFAIRKRDFWKHTALYLIVYLLLISPWLIRNHILFGEAFFGHTINSTYLYIKAGVPSQDYVYSHTQHLKVLTLIFSRWLPFNLYFVARKLFILAPILFVTFAYSIADYATSWKRIRVVFPVLIILLGHLAISTAWPVTKFRYFVPLLPLVLLLSVHALEQMRLSSRSKQNIYAATFLCTAALSFLTYWQIPTHTYYYDGAITQDAFSGEGEIEFMKQQGKL